MFMFFYELSCVSKNTWASPFPHTNTHSFLKESALHFLGTNSQNHLCSSVSPSLPPPPRVERDVPQVCLLLIDMQPPYVYLFTCPSLPQWVPWELLSPSPFPLLRSRLATKQVHHNFISLKNYVPDINTRYLNVKHKCGKSLCPFKSPTI